MKIAVTYENGNVFQHFGRTAQFKIYTVEDGKIVAAQVIDTDGSGHGALAGFLESLGASVLICDGIGAGARFALQDVDIQVFGGVTGDADEVAEAFAAGVLAYDPEACCIHHHGAEHSCGHHEHSCGHHGCGHH